MDSCVYLKYEITRTPVDGNMLSKVSGLWIFSVSLFVWRYALRPHDNRCKYVLPTRPASRLHLIQLGESAVHTMFVLVRLHGANSEGYELGAHRTASPMHLELSSRL